MFIQLNKLLPREFGRHGLKKEVEALGIINEFNKSAAAYLGEHVLNYIQAKVYKNKILYIDAANSSAAQVLFLKQHEILEALNSSLFGAGLKGKKVEKFIIKTIN